MTSHTAIGEDAVEVHSVTPEGVGDVLDLVEAENVEGKAAQDRADGWAFSNPAGILLHGDVEHVMDAVLDTPMAARRTGVVFGGLALLGRCVPSSFVWVRRPSDVKAHGSVLHAMSLGPPAAFNSAPW